MKAERRQREGREVIREAGTWGGAEPTSYKKDCGLKVMRSYEGF